MAILRTFKMTKPGKPPLFKIGDRIGRLVVRTVEPGCPRQYECICDCGTVRMFSSPVLKSKAQSCGCLRKEITSETKRTHGMSESRTYRIWAGMHARCNRSGEQNYKYYGGRGITVCQQWKSFAAFLRDMGVAPEGHTIERIDVNGDYEPSNCKWLLARLQNRNTRRVRMIEFRGQSKCLAEWAEDYGITYNLLRDRLNRGWDMRRALEDRR